jgi:hypothetical protein
MYANIPMHTTLDLRRPPEQTATIDQAEPICCPVRWAAVSICKSVGVEEIAVTTNDHSGEPSNGGLTASERLAGIGVDWWATIVAGVVVLLAVAGLLPKIPW